jgi:hypothetical protein
MPVSTNVFIIPQAVRKAIAMKRHDFALMVRSESQKKISVTRSQPLTGAGERISEVVLPVLRSTPRYVAIGLVALLAILAGGDRALAINNGQNDEDNVYSNVGTIIVDFGGGNLSQYCTGTLIDDRAILTAAHCTAGIEGDIAAEVITKDDVYFSFDPNDPLNNVASWLPVSGTSSHPDYVGIPAFYDVGMLFLGADAPAGVDPAGLAPTGYLDDLEADGTLSRANRSEFTVVGYGIERSFPQRVFNDPGGIRRRFANAKFQNLEPNFLHLNQVQSPGLDNGGTCFGDSGGPGFWMEGDSPILTSVTSWGDFECVATDKRQRIDLPSVQSYIDAELLAAAGSSTSVASVPEPNGSILALFCLTVVASLRRRHPRQAS